MGCKRTQRCCQLSQAGLEQVHEVQVSSQELFLYAPARVQDMLFPQDET